MVSRLVPRGVLAAVAGATLMIAASSAPASAFTLASASLDQPVASSDVQQAYWGYHHWGWHRWGWHRWGWHPYWHPYWHPWRHCWWTWHGRVCRW